MTNNGKTGRPIGLYLHIPFCERKCAYCDFYSSFLNEELLDRYTKRLIDTIKWWGGNINRPINTIYLGGGTPSLLKERLSPVIDSVKANFTVTDDAEITLEMNPSSDTERILKSALNAGVNRLSIGAQSGNDEELKVLGRTHNAANTAKAVHLARQMGFDNISLDLMIGLPSSNTQTLTDNLDFITSLDPEHISAYILKVEENTAFYHNRNSLQLPDDDEQAEQYLLMCKYLEEKGYSHYEISNFCKDGYESHHNQKYWNDEEYLGIGPAAHSFLDNKRFYYPRDMKVFLNDGNPVYEDTGGTAEEYFMLRLRLKNGLSYNEFQNKFGFDIKPMIEKKCSLYADAGLINLHDFGFSLTDNGMILSNSIIAELLEDINENS